VIRNLGRLHLLFDTPLAVGRRGSSRSFASHSALCSPPTPALNAAGGPAFHSFICILSISFYGIFLRPLNEPRRSSESPSRPLGYCPLFTPNYHSPISSTRTGVCCFEASWAWMSSAVCLSLVANLRCSGLRQREAVAILVPPVVEAVLISILIYTQWNKGR